MANNRHAEENVVGYYFNDDSVTSDIMRRIQEARINRDELKIGSKLIVYSKKEIQTKRKSMANSTYPAAKDLNDRYFSKTPFTEPSREDIEKRVLLFLMDGVLMGYTRSIDTVVGVSFGTRFQELFKKHDGAGNKDDDITERERSKYLEDSEYGAFILRSSRFYWLSAQEAKRFAVDGGIDDALDMPRLIPLISETRGYVGTQDAVMPSYDEFIANVPRFTSYRLKKSLRTKILRKLGLPNITEEEKIHDWVAHRMLVDSIEDARAWEEFFITNPTLGNSHFTYIMTDDHYASDKPYNGLNMVMEVRTRAHHPVIREIQVVDKQSFYDNEINKKSIASREEKIKKARPNKKVKTLGQLYGHDLSEMFGNQFIPAG